MGVFIFNSGAEAGFVAVGFDSRPLGPVGLFPL